MTPLANLSQPGERNDSHKPSFRQVSMPQLCWHRRGESSVSLFGLQESQRHFVMPGPLQADGMEADMAA